MKPRLLFINISTVILVFVPTIICAQSTFLKEFKNSTWATSIVEDNKRGLHISAGLHEHSANYRLDSKGNIMFSYGVDVGKLYFKESLNHIYYFGNGVPDIGSLQMECFDIKGKSILSSYREPGKTTEWVADFIDDTLRGQLILCGSHHKSFSGSPSGYWIAGMDYEGKVLWENWFSDSGNSRYFSKVFLNPKTGGYFLLSSDDKQYDRHELFNVDSVGNFLNRNPIEPSPCLESPVSPRDFNITDLCSFKDTNFIAPINVYTSCNPNPENGLYFYLYNSQGKLLKRIKHFWAVGNIEAISNGRFMLYAGNFIVVLDAELNYLFSKDIFSKNSFELIEIKQVHQSHDGGFYGMAEGYRVLNTAPPWEYENVVYVFKTDKFGNINNEPEYIEMQQPVMLQPNPARDKVRIAIPYYYGTISAKIYDALGHLLIESTQIEQNYIDISKLAPGVYSVDAQIMETGQTRKMKLVVE